MERPGQTSCEAIGSLLGGFSEGSLEEATEGRVREHLAVCDACRSALRELDPSALFLGLRGRTLPEAFWAGFDERLRSQLPVPGFRWTDMLRYPRLAYFTAPLAMLLVVGATLFILQPRIPGVRGRRAAPGIRSPYLGPAAPSPVARPSRRGASPELRGLQPADAQIEPSGPPVLEEVDSPGARVYRFSVGESGDETDIYLVVDGSIDI
ncbi:MAG: zf-HC2 domain-containing protein [Acidobacteriota bacterium]